MMKNKATVYEIVTDRIVGILERGTVPWRQPWGTIGYRKPLNVRGTEYRGINVFILSSMGYGSRYWLTFRQAKELGGSIRKGEKATPVVFWKWIEREEKDETTGETVKRSRPLLRYYNVFNVEQTEGLPEKFYRTESTSTVEPIPACEAILASYPNPPAIRNAGERAFYSPSADSVTVPAPEAFTSSAAYFATLFHELGHSTGHESRLSREGVTDAIMFGSHRYSREELVAEMTAAFLCGKAGIDSAPIVENQAAYIASWIKALEGSPKLAVIAAAQAQKAADWILGVARGDEEESTEEAAG